MFCRLDLDQCTRKHAFVFFDVVDPDYYEFEGKTLVYSQPGVSYLISNAQSASKVILRRNTNYPTTRAKYKADLCSDSLSAQLPNVVVPVLSPAPPLLRPSSCGFLFVCFVFVFLCFVFVGFLFVCFLFCFVFCLFLLLKV